MDLVSIIIPTYKGASALSRAVDSVLSQAYQDIQVIVVDDNDPDSEGRTATENVMAKYTDAKVLYLRHEHNKNGAAARNTGIAAAKGTYIAFLDDDDYYLPERIEKSVAFLESHKDYAGVYVGVDLIDADGNIIHQVRPDKELLVRELLLDEMVVGTGSNIFLRKEVVGKVNGFDSAFVRRQDTEFMIRVCENGRIGFIPEKLIIKSVNGTMNHPKYRKMKAVIEQFTGKFSDEIDELGEAKGHYYATQYRTLFGIALYEGDKAEIKEARELITRYDKLTAKEKILSFIYSHGLRDNAIVSALIGANRKAHSKSAEK